jgi:hypothetical protein
MTPEVCYGQGQEEEDCWAMRGMSARHARRIANVASEPTVAPTDTVPCTFTALPTTSAQSDRWYLDSGVSNRRCREHDLVDFVQPCAQPQVDSGHGSRVPIVGSGNIPISVPPAARGQPDRLITLTDVCLVPRLATNMVSAACLSEAGLGVSVSAPLAVIRHGKQVVAMADLDEANNLYRVRIATRAASPTAGTITASQDVDFIEGQLGTKAWGATAESALPTSLLPEPSSIESDDDNEPAATLALDRCAPLPRPPSILLQQQQRPAAAPLHTVSPLSCEQKGLQDVSDSSQLDPGQASFLVSINTSSDGASALPISLLPELASTVSEDDVPPTAVPSPNMLPTSQSRQVLHQSRPATASAQATHQSHLGLAPASAAPAPATTLVQSQLGIKAWRATAESALPASLLQHSAICGEDEGDERSALVPDLNALLLRSPSNLLQPQPAATAARAVHQPQPDFAPDAASPAAAAAPPYGPLPREQMGLRDISDFGELDPVEASFLPGCNIRSGRARRSIGQSAYVTALIERHGMSDCKPCSTPTAKDFFATVAKAAATASEVDRASDTIVRDYQAVIGLLMFAMICTRPDVAYAINTLAQFASNPLPVYSQALKRVLRYLRGTVNRRITYTDTDTDTDAGTDAADAQPELLGYSDASWASINAAAASKAMPAGGIISYVTALLERHVTCFCTRSEHSAYDGSSHMLGLSESSSRGAVSAAS